MDRIVVAIDEASVLFTVEKSSRSTRATAEKARDLTDRIAKLGRAAAINIIIATQKVVKETIDTRVQTNINARMVFRVNTVASSMTVLGNKLASELPEIQGRGIWSVGSRDIEVQTPFLDIDEVAERLEVLAKKFERGRKSFFGPMLAQAKAEDKTNNAFEAEGVDDQVAS
jgi:DNA segregation ATPase FtsK/SpoIIIE-like protein